jgi:hypothetical protein
MLFKIKLKVKKGSHCFHEDSYYLTVNIDTKLDNYSKTLLEEIDSVDAEEFVRDMNDIHETFSWFQKMYDNHNLTKDDDITEQYEEVLGLIRKKFRSLTEKYSLIYEEDKK